MMTIYQLRLYSANQGMCSVQMIRPMWFSDKLPQIGEWIRVGFEWLRVQSITSVKSVK